MGVPTESWAKVNRWYHGGGGHVYVDSSDEDHADGEEIVVIMGVMRVKSFSRSGKVEGVVEAKYGSIAKSFLAEKRTENRTK